MFMVITNKKVEMVPVASSNIAAIGYEPIHQNLLVKFRADNKTYVYLNVPSFVWKHMQKSVSKGQFLREIIIPYFKFTIDK
jgi:KTSC domain